MRLNIQFFGGRGSNSMGGSKSRSFEGGNWVTRGGPLNPGGNPTKQAEKILSAIQKAPIGTNIAVTKPIEEYNPETHKYEVTNRREVYQTFRISGTLRNKVLRVMHDEVEGPATIPLSDRDALFKRIDGSDATIRMQRGSRTRAEREAQKEESNAERRQGKIKF